MKKNWIQLLPASNGPLLPHNLTFKKQKPPTLSPSSTPKKKSHSKKLSIHTAIVCQTAWNDLQRLSNCSVGVPGFRLPGTLRSFFGLVHLCPPGALATAFNAFGLLLPRGFRRREETMMYISWKQSHLFEKSNSIAWFQIFGATATKSPTTRMDGHF